MISNDNKKNALLAQGKEATEYQIYKGLSGLAKNEHNRGILLAIAQDELADYNLWKNYTGEESAPDKLKVRLYLLIARLFGVTFAIRLAERGSKQITEAYRMLGKSLPGGMSTLTDWANQEKDLTGLLNEERLQYIGNIVLGLDDALVELTGTLAGFTFALQNPRVIAAAGLISGIAASLSMSASTYFSAKSVKGDLNASKAAAYTGLTYVVTVFFLILPYLFLGNPYYCLALVVVETMLIIFGFTFYSSVTQGTPFLRRFREMLVVSVAVSTVTFGIGYIVKTFFNINI